ncbi:MAG: c-type cytochrome [Acidobacteriota bacterium]|nr:c-type cytochrome [Acidobacteriota bacterium]
MKNLIPAFAAASVLSLAAFAVTSYAQPPQEPAAPAAPAAEQHRWPPPPPPTNLQVLPKDTSGEQVRKIMHQWEGDLGTECSTCHAADPKNIGPNGKPRLNFADDSKKEKATARTMYKMVEEINTQYVGKVDSSGMPVTCGTCHRGKVSPDPYIPPKEDEHEHQPPAPPAAPAGMTGSVGN